MNRNYRCIGVGVLLVSAAMIWGCEERQATLPSSLEAPVKLAIVNGDVCLPLSDRDDGTISTRPLIPCEEGGRGFGLVANIRTNSVAVVALGQQDPRMVNLDARIPGVTPISVGEGPVDLAITGDGTAALVASQTGSTLTGIDLWTLRALEQEVELSGIPQAIASVTRQDEQDPRIALVTSGPNQLSLRGGLRCERPADEVDRRDHDPGQSCQWASVDEADLALPGRPVDLAVDAESGLAWVIYRDLNALSVFALDEAALADGEACLQAGATPPCEMAQIPWEEDEAEHAFGATAVEADPLGLFVYVLDRPNSRLLVYDRTRNQLINASEAAEPALVPFSREPGILLSASPTALAAEVKREVVESGDASMVRYFIGAQVAADNGQLYQVGVIDVECVFEGEAALSWEEFVFDAQARQQSAESACILAPAFLMDGDRGVESDEELLERRVIENDGALIAVTPILALRDGQARQGRLVGRAQCTHPEGLVEAMRAEAGDAAVLGCGSPLAPQPLAPQVEQGGALTFADAERAELMSLTRAVLTGTADNPEVELLRQVFDLRLVNEEWSVTYEGPLPGVGTTERGLVHRDEAGIFLSGGADYCATAVEVGDRLTILSNPLDSEECEAFHGDEGFLTYRVVEVRPFEVEIAVMDAADDRERVAELPTRTCFDRGLRYEIRADDEWTVVGAQSGMTSPFERQGDACVLKEGAETGRLQGRVATGQEYIGPYLRLRIHEGAVDPVQDTQYTFQVERNFGLAAEAFVPSARDGSQSTVASDVVFTPDLGVGQIVLVVDSGANRIFMRNLSTGEGGRFLY